jgi:HNH endonuclease
VRIFGSLSELQRRIDCAVTKLPGHGAIWEWTSAGPTYRRLLNDNCWITTYRINRYGYARIKVGGMTVQGHRVAYMAFRGSYPEDRPDTDHLCLDKRCWNPRHLEPVTLTENNRRRAFWVGRKIFCDRGHYTGAATVCPSCKQASARQEYLRHRPAYLARARAAHARKKAMQ